MDFSFFQKQFKIYPDSINSIGADICFMVDAGERDQLCIVGDSRRYPGERHSHDGNTYWLSELDHDTAKFLRKHFSFCVPVPVLDRHSTFGVGDRLGLAGEGHLRVFKEYQMMPVLAQQSVREMALTHRTMDDVIDSATFSVFREGYRGGFGADGDHLKHLEEVREAIAHGYTMITLDCSDHIDNEAAILTDEEISARCEVDPELRERYLTHSFAVSAHTILKYDLCTLRRIVAVYGNAIEFINKVYFDCIASHASEVNFEISIDETLTVTSPLDHFFVTNELRLRGIRFSTIAPRFSGEFQKGIDYIGDHETLRKEVRSHNDIARFFGYKLSIHSGSDKFSVFPIIGKETEGFFHVKTSGTSWLEALRVLAKCEPVLFKEIWDVAVTTFEENRKNYRVTPDLSTIPDLNDLSEKALCTLLDNAASRQVLHIAYGKILEDKGLKRRLYQAIRKHRWEYSEMLYHHIGRHAQTLGVCHIGDLKLGEQHAPTRGEKTAGVGMESSLGMSQCI